MCVHFHVLFTHAYLGAQAGLCVFPHTGAGLGGGSGNAATTLWAANELTGKPATTAQLLQWSGDIGSDISVFFRLVCAPVSASYFILSSLTKEES
jgi:hypothetical protein